MKGIYLAAFQAYHDQANIIYQDIEQRQDFKNGGYVIKYEDMKNKAHQGGYNVHNVIQQFLKDIGAIND